MIRGFFNPGLDWPEPYVRAHMLLPDLSDRWAPVEFLVDTGSTATCVHPGDSLLTLHIDAARLVDASQWRQSEQRGGVGGQALYYIVRAVYNFLHDDGSEFEMASELRVAAPTPSNLQLPSILGWDILQHFTFTTDWRTRVVRLAS